MDRTVQNRFGLYWRAQNDGKRAAEFRQIIENSDIAAVYLFHGDGFVREAALNALASPITHSVVAYGLIRRLNDWSPNVRSAARRALSRCFGQSEPSVLVPAIWVVLRDGAEWGRWKQGYAGLINEIMQHPQLAQRLVLRLQSETRAGTSTIFQALCQNPKIDGFLGGIALSAHQPHLRAGALRCIAMDKVVWPLGRSRKAWIDKSLGQYKMVADYGSRPLSVDFDLAAVLRTALRDRSVVVQKQMLDALSLHRHDPRFLPLIVEILELLSSDTRPPIRSRLAFLKSHMPTPS